MCEFIVSGIEHFIPASKRRSKKECFTTQTQTMSQ
jgi:hypothetical protein